MINLEHICNSAWRLAMFTLAPADAYVFQVQGNTYMLYVFDMTTDQGRIL